MIHRTLAKTILGGRKAGFITIIYGPRRVGKTFLLKEIQKKFPEQKTLLLNGDTQESRDLLNTTSLTRLSETVKNYSSIIIDEAQRIPSISLVLKILIDNFPEKNIIITGSTSLRLSRGVSETLTGRTIKYYLYPLSTVELTAEKTNIEKQYFLPEQLIYGGYPYIKDLSSVEDKKRYLISIIDDYLFQDILDLKEVAVTDNLRKLATLLAYQIGQEVSFNELSLSLKIDVKTVIRYIDLLKQGFIVFEVGAFSKNLRKEVVKNKKYYFWDLGIRNALLGLFTPLEARGDIGFLWENFLAVERTKKVHYENKIVQTYFWRTYDNAEIDWIELEGQKISAYEFKWRSEKGKTPKSFFENYKEKVTIINKNNYLNFIA
ncbi:MAG: ATP-binding protein [Patescibacteria group bacterium]